MVLERLITVSDAIKNPWHMIIFGGVISLIALSIAYVVFPENVGLVTVFLITIMSAPFMWRLFRYDEWHEEKDLKNLKGFWPKFAPNRVLQRQASIFLVYGSFFLGITMALSVAYLFLPEDVAQRAFNDQTDQIEKIGNAVGNFANPTLFDKILINNMIVLAVSFIFALLFGIGAVFVLTWNASVLAAAIGILTHTTGNPLAFGAFVCHGVPEIAAYIMAGITGAIISVAITKRHNKLLMPVLRDMLLFMILAAVLIVVAAFIEVNPICTEPF